MRIAVVGDTHGRIEKIKTELIKVKIDHMFFTGDYYSDAKRIAYHLGVSYNAIAGNCDSGSSGHSELLINMAGKTFYLVHGHQYNVKTSLNNLYYRGKELEADIVLFGHTHISYCEKMDDMWFVNPGSPSRPRLLDKGSSYALLDINKNYLLPQIINL